MRYAHKRRRIRRHHVAKKTTRRRRHVGALSMSASSPLIKLGSVAVGYFLADTLNPMLDKLVPTSTTITENVKGIGQAGIGTLLVMGKLGKRRPGVILTAAGGILAGSGLKRVLKANNIISGYGMVPVVGAYTPNVSLNGYQRVPVIGGYQTANVPINGVPAHKKVMGAVSPGESGSGRMNTGSGYMD